MRRFILWIILPILILSVLAGCSQTKAVSFSQLTSQSDKYNGKTVSLEAFYFDAFEMMALCESLQPSTSMPGYLAPSGTLIWLEGGLPQSIHSQLFVQPLDAATGYPQHYGKVVITGIFQADGQYGHLGAYQYQINVSEVQLLNWTPPSNK